MNELAYTWNGVDTNFVWRGTDKWGLRGLRVNGGTSTGRAVRDQCRTDRSTARTSRQHDGDAPPATRITRWDTNVRGTAAYTIRLEAVGDVLVSTVFQWRPRRRAEREPRLHQGPGDVGSRAAPLARRSRARPARRLARSDALRAQGTTVTATSYTVNLLNPGELYGEGYTIFDLKLGKNIRFASKRLNVGVDIYNLFNNDAVGRDSDTFPATTPGVAMGQPTALLSPRFVRLRCSSTSNLGT